MSAIGNASTPVHVNERSVAKEGNAIPAIPDAGRLLEFTEGKYHVKVDDTLKNSDGSVKEASFVGINSSGKLVGATPPATLTFDQIYPVGTVYTTIDPDFNPAVPFGGTWKIMAKGKCLFGATDDQELNKSIAAGLPAVPRHQHNVPLSEDDAGAGSIGKPCTAKHGSSTDSSGYQHCNHFCSTGEAGATDEIYGTSNTVQPPAVTVRFWKRTA